MIRLPSVARTIALLCACASPAAHAADATVGSGTPASCDEAALDAAIALLAPAGTLSFDCGAADHALALNTVKSLSGNVVVDGGGRIVLDGQYATPLLATSGSGSVIELRGLRLHRGYAAGGYGGCAAVASGTSLRVLDSTIGDCSADYSGGAIHTAGGSTLELRRSRIENAQAAHGGAIAANGNVALIDSTFSANVAGASGEGGAVQIWFGTLTATDTRFTQNVGYIGGALHQRGGSATLTRVRFDQNHATLRGGAVLLREGASLSGTEVSFDDNLADESGGALFLSAHDDGVPGTAVPDTAALLQRPRFLGNLAMSEGGAVFVDGPSPLNAGGFGMLVVQHGVFGNNRAPFGGAILQSGQATFEDSRFESNIADYGGALSLIPGWPQSAPMLWGYTALTRVVIADNEATFDGGGLHGGGIPIFDQVQFNRNHARRHGGAIALVTRTAPIAQASFVDNNAEYDGGAIHLRGLVGQELINLSFSGNATLNPLGHGGDIAVMGGHLINTSISLRHCTLRNGQSANGAALYVSSLGGRADLENNAILAAGASSCFGFNGVSQGGNAMPADCSPTHPTDLIITTAADLGLGALSNFGSDTFGFVPQPGSALIDRTDCSAGRTIDQRGRTAPIDGDGNGLARCDSGAIERQPTEPQADIVLLADGFED
ncbi:MAG: hypothetical protein IPG63_10990 [Xanthomonadales bacterium]|nr:hypothetical protein [Xanthomonadales bacterium]MBK7145939.1 hypothetical protein [Xanthomonadales bacterium]